MKLITTLIQPEKLEDVKRALEALRAVAEAEERVLDEPEPTVKLNNLDDGRTHTQTERERERPVINDIRDGTQSGELQ